MSTHKHTLCTFKEWSFFLDKLPEFLESIESEMDHGRLSVQITTILQWGVTVCQLNLKRNIKLLIIDKFWADLSQTERLNYKCPSLLAACLESLVPAVVSWYKKCGAVLHGKTAHQVLSKEEQYSTILNRPQQWRVLGPKGGQQNLTDGMRCIGFDGQKTSYDENVYLDERNEPYIFDQTEGHSKDSPSLSVSQ